MRILCSTGESVGSRVKTQQVKTLEVGVEGSGRRESPVTES